MITCKIDENGKIPLFYQQAIKKLLLSLAGKQVSIDIQEAKQKRGSKANRYYWGVLVDCARRFRLEQCENLTPKEVHEDLLLAFSPQVERIGLDGKTRLAPLRSSKMTKEQFYNYCMQIEVALSELGVSLPAHPQYAELLQYRGY